MKKILFVLFLLGLVSDSIFASSPTKPIEVGTGNAYRPFAFVNDKNQMDGFDIDVLKILNKHDKGLNFKFNGVQWNAVFPGLDSGKFDLLAYQITKTKEREEKYIFSDYPYFNDISGVIVRENQNITDFKQLNNQKIGVSVGSNYARDLENYLKAHKDLQIEIKYYKNPPALIADLGANRIQAIIGEPISSINIAKAQNINLKATEIILDKTPVYFVFNKKDTALKDKVSKALKKAIDSKDLSKLSIQYFGQDLSK
ncbi:MULTISPECIES: transporter substrate-binding domain-containing protein [Helicobacter]|uniref:Amino acid ABC transporter, periplasmic amino acid-binding portion n=1 Tax=Helicobacter typhlonius TaxID=76936 RepID=A0A099UI96_9HELI|nr:MULTISPECIES: transporter substrate-binding domain-containing protein [Helicobacter]TLD78912.1 transporter substrate-binding domain-containing protein [Helicobacter typhlonius]TLD90245.1 transporter substrate-binding domain-containing protein [Helicobacter sp. MIT 03-1616]CUU40927.1 Amino acid ABC transporter, periplasmic amino acid-binding portion [Helicobacter typhlonius]